MTSTIITNTKTDTDFAATCDEIVEIMERQHIPGAAIGILHGHEDWTAGFGVTSVENPLPVTPDTLFQIGSITKTVTATAAMRLVQMGKLDLDAPLTTYLPGLHLTDQSVAERVTMRHLLTHSGGWVGDYFDDFGPGPDALSQMVAQMAALPQVTPLGRLFSYNNTGFCLAGRIVEVITGMGYESAVRELVLRPLSMDDSFFSPADVITRRFAAGHYLHNGRPKVARPWDVGRALYPTAGLSSTVHDMMRYLRLYLGTGLEEKSCAHILSPETIAEMLAPQLPAGCSGQSVGLSWMLRDVEGVQVALHDGDTNGQVAEVMLVPEERFAMVILTNGGTGDILCHEMVRNIRKRYLGLGFQESAEIDLTEAESAALVGLYTSPMRDIDVTLHEGRLSMQIIFKAGFPKKDSPAPLSPPPTGLAFSSKDCLYIPRGPFKGQSGDFIRDENGHATHLRMFHRIFVRQM